MYENLFYKMTKGTLKIILKAKIYNYIFTFQL
jgi:hypothetical protein